MFDGDRLALGVRDLRRLLGQCTPPKWIDASHLGLRIRLDVDRSEFWMEAHWDAQHALIVLALDMLLAWGYELLSQEEDGGTLTEDAWVRIHLTPIIPTCNYAHCEAEHTAADHVPDDPMEVS
ncbi:hypothetical protein [Kineococcus esterisolvens]|uniref:hypothetical protein n=1 Tax=unclassified Kineococcus TaxID=2621656 RepID=UPI003D7C9B70